MKSTTLKLVKAWAGKEDAGVDNRRSDILWFIPTPWAKILLRVRKAKSKECFLEWRTKTDRQALNLTSSDPKRKELDIDSNLALAMQITRNEKDKPPPVTRERRTNPNITPEGNV